MSGGSYDYVTYRIHAAGEELRTRHPKQAHVLALAAHLIDLADLMHAIEWADSGDTAWDDALDARIREFGSADAELGEAVAVANVAHEMLTDAIARAARVRDGAT